MSAAPLSPKNPVSHGIQAIFWIYLHLLEFNLSNQVHNPEEDKRNKPWRPLPSGRISLERAITLKRIAIVACLLISLHYGVQVFYASLLFAIFIPMHHELHGDQHWLTKNLMNAVGYSCFGIGSTLIACEHYINFIFFAMLEAELWRPSASGRSIKA